MPLHTQQEAEFVLKQFVTIDFDKEQRLFEGSHFTFSRAGHILGSAFNEHIDTLFKSVIDDRCSHENHVFLIG